MEQKAHTHLPQSEGNDQSGKVENEVFEFEAFGFLFNLHVVKGREVRGIIVISEFYFGMSQLFIVDEFESLSPNVEEFSILYFFIFIVKLETKDPYLSEVNETMCAGKILLYHFHNLGVVDEGKADLTNGGRLLVFARIDNEVLKEWVFFELFSINVSIDDKVDVWLQFPDCTHYIVDCAYLFVSPHFSEFSFRVVSDVKVLKLKRLFLNV